MEKVVLDLFMRKFQDFCSPNLPTEKSPEEGGKFF